MDVCEGACMCMHARGDQKSTSGVIPQKLPAWFLYCLGVVWFGLVWFGLVWFDLGFLRQVSLYSFGFYGTHSLDQAGLTLRDLPASAS